MNYFLKSKVEDIYDAQFYNETIYYKSENKGFSLCEASKDNMIEKWDSKSNVIFYAITNDLIIHSSDSIQTKIVNRFDKKSVLTINRYFSFNNNLINDNYILGNAQKNLYIYNIPNYQETTFTDMDFTFYILKDNLAICRNKNRNILSCRDVENNLKLVWLLDISQFGTYYDIIRGECKKKIYNTYIYKDKLIVAISRAVIALDFKTGELIWKLDINDENPMTLLIQNSTAYMSVGVHYKVIDLEKGELVFERKTSEIQYEGKKLIYNNDNPGAIINWHDNKIWSLFNWDAQRYLASFAPETLELQSIQPIPIYDQHRQPVFDGNRLYVLEDSGTLNIFEKE